MGTYRLFIGYIPCYTSQTRSLVHPRKSKSQDPLWPPPRYAKIFFGVTQKPGDILHALITMNMYKNKYVCVYIYKISTQAHSNLNVIYCHICAQIYTVPCWNSSPELRPEFTSCHIFKSPDKKNPQSLSVSSSESIRHPYRATQS